MFNHASTSPEDGVKRGSEKDTLGILTKQLNRTDGESLNPYAQAAKMPGKFKLQRQAQKLLPEKRVSTCYRNVYESRGPGEVWGRSANGKAEFVNLWVCGSPWDCPVCSSKISASRSQMVLKAMEYARALGLVVDLLTLTVPHSVHQSARHVMGALTSARTHFKNSKAYKAYKLESRWIGEIWATEVTFGRNGWHCHNHALVFAERHGLENLRSQWTASVLKSGLGLVNDRGYRVDDGSRAGEYVSKWGLEHELTRADLKKTRFGGRTPFQLLADSMNGCDLSGALFVEYSEAFHGRPQLLWTNGLKAILHVDDDSDESLAESSEIDSNLSSESWFLDQAAWMLVLGANMRGELLYYAAKFGQFGVDALVSKLRGLEEIDSPYYFSMPKHRVGC